MRGNTFKLRWRFYGKWWEGHVWRGIWRGRYNSLQTYIKDLVKSIQNMIVFINFRSNRNRTRYIIVDDSKINNGLREREWGGGKMGD